MTAEKKKTPWIGAFMVIELGVGLSIGTMVDQAAIGTAIGIGLGILAGAMADRIRQSRDKWFASC